MEKGRSVGKRDGREGGGWREEMKKREREEGSICRGKW